MAFRGVYINLDRSSERRAATEAMLRRGGLIDSYSRFVAVDGKTLPPGGKGWLSAAQKACFASHAGAAALAGPEWLHVIEDDHALMPGFRPTVAGLIDSAGFSAYDLVFTSINLAGVPIGLLPRLEAAYQNAAANSSIGLLDLGELSFTGANSYFINPAAASRLTMLLREAQAGDGPRLPIDIFYRRCTLDGRLKAACTFPFLSCPNLATSPVSSIGRGGHANALAFDLLRSAFCPGADAATIRDAIGALAIRVTPHTALLGSICQAISAALPDQEDISSQPD